MDGAVETAFFTILIISIKNIDEPSVRLSIVKRVTGQIHGMVKKRASP